VDGTRNACHSGRPVSDRQVHPRRHQRGVGISYLAAAPLAFVAAVTNNYLLNRLWTFRRQRGHFVHQGARFFIVALCALGASLVILKSLVELGVDEIGAQAIAIVVVTPINFLSNKFWSFAR
jgi:putative flippase GtrA